MEQEQQHVSTLEDVPLQDFTPTPMVAQPTPQDCVSPETAAAQLEKYKIKMGTSIEIALKYLLPNDKWQLIPSPPGGGGAISLFELPEQTSPYYNLKAVAVCQGRASRYFHVIKDHDPHTRMPWDKDNVTHIQQMETYMAEEGEIVVVESTWKSRNPYLFSDRHVLGIMSHHFDPELATYSLYFTTAEHYHFKSPPSAPARGGGGEVAAQVLLCVILRKLTDETTEVTIMLRIDPNLSRFSTMSLFFENKYKEELRKRIALYEFVVQRWNDFYGPKNDPKKIENRR